MEKISEQFLETLSNKKIEEIFKDTEIVSNDLGEFVKITNPFGVIEEKHIITDQELMLLEGVLKQNLSILPGIGSNKLKKFHKKHYFCLDDLLGLDPKYSQISEILNAISEKKVNELKKISRIKEEELIFCVNPEDILFLDIETTGQQPAGMAEVFLIGIGYLKKNENEKFNFTTELLFAREIAEEAAILKYFTDILPKYKMLVTYNGKSFDIPFLRERIGTLFDPEDISDVYDFFKENTFLNSSMTPDLQYPSAIAAEIFSSYIHFDLYYALRRTYKVLLENYRLVTAEEKILDFHRIDNLPSSEVPQVYQDWLSSSDKGKNMGAIYKVFEHNFYDVVNMEKLLKEYLLTRVDEAFKLIQPAIKEEQLLNDLNNDYRGRKEDIYKLLKYFNSKKKKKHLIIDNYL